jgi:cytochrome c-type biogenesis protein CcmH/NrfG
MPTLANEFTAALARYEKDDDLGVLLDTVRSVAESADVDELLAAVRVHEDRHEIVIPAYERIIAQRPTDARALVVLANAYWLTGRGPEAVEALAERAKAADPTNRGAWHLWALSEGHARSRVERWQRVIAEFPDDLVGRAALADNAASLAGAEHDPLALELAVRTYEGLWQESPTPTQRRALEETLEALRGWKL